LVFGKATFLVCFIRNRSQKIVCVKANLQKGAGRHAIDPDSENEARLSIESIRDALPIGLGNAPFKRSYCLGRLVLER
jgi:hypothetical protein